MLLPILRAATHTVRDTHAIGSVADDNLGMFGITEMAMKIADAPQPGAPHHLLAAARRRPLVCCL